MKEKEKPIFLSGLFFALGKNFCKYFNKLAHNILITLFITKRKMRLLQGKFYCKSMKINILTFLDIKDQDWAFTLTLFSN